MTQLGRDSVYPGPHRAEDTTGGEWFDAVAGERIRILVDSRTVGGAYTVVESVAQPMAGPPLHRHEGDEIFHIVEGCFHFQRGPEAFEATEGSVVVVRGGTPHCWFNFGPRPARMMVIFAPGGVEDMFLALRHVAPEDLPAFAAQHRIDVLGPPLGFAAA